MAQTCDHYSHTTNDSPSMGKKSLKIIYIPSACSFSKHLSHKFDNWYILGVKYGQEVLSFNIGVAIYQYYILTLNNCNKIMNFKITCKLIGSFSS